MLNIMEFSIFKGLNQIEFTEKFSSDEVCMCYLKNYKWGGGFKCTKCGSDHFYVLKKNEFIRECADCRHINSVTAGTLFHKIKFSLKKAFHLVYYMACTTKNVSAHQAARMVGINKNTAWLFSHKLRKAMESSGVYPLKGDVEVDEFFVGGLEKGKMGRGNETKSLVGLAIEKSGKHGIKRAYAIKIDNASSLQLKKLFDKHIDPSAKVLTDKWRGYSPLKEVYNITQEKSEPDKNFKEMHRFIQGIKSWYRGIHHHISLDYLQGYLNEYCYRFNRSISKETRFDNLIQRMIEKPPMDYQKLIVNYSS